MKFNITLTWSKIVALILAIFGFILELSGHQGIFYLTLPVVASMIMGKQYIDKNIINK